MDNKARLEYKLPLLLSDELLLVIVMSTKETFARVSSTGLESITTKTAIGKSIHGGIAVFFPSFVSSTRFHRYEGHWANDSFNGKGIYSDCRGSKYNGEWKQDKMHGKGVYIDAQGNEFDGYFHQGKFHGSGKLKSTSGDYYEGEFR